MAPRKTYDQELVGKAYQEGCPYAFKVTTAEAVSLSVPEGGFACCEFPASCRCMRKKAYTSVSNICARKIGKGFPGPKTDLQ